MATIQQSIEVKVPVHMVYDRLTRFEEYPRFMEDVESVQQIDDTHLHWTTKMANRPVEWDAEITEQEPDRCIAWRNTSGPTNSGKVKLQQSGPDTAQVTFTLHSAPEQVQGSMAGYTEEELALRLKQDLARLKDFIEGHGSGTGGGSVQQGSAEAPSSSRDATRAGGAGNSAIVGASGGTDAAAGARLSGSKGGPGGPSPRQTSDAAGAPGGSVQGNAINPASGAGAAGGTGLGSAATADETRTGTGTTSGSGTALTGGGMSGARDAGVPSGKGNPPKP
jgi:uncharacterized membrane protein